MTDSSRPAEPALPLGDVPSGAMPSRNLEPPRRALAIVAHPDDAEFQCGGTLAKWASDGCEVSVLVLTDGSKGTWDVHADTAALIERRREEQIEAARRCGATGKVVLLGHTDGELQPTLHVRDQVTWWIRSLQPGVVFAHDPWKRYRLHPDHRNAGWLAIDAVAAARDPHYFGHHDVSVHRPDAVLLFEADEPDHVEDISVSIDSKVAALLAHESQFVTTHSIPPDDDGSARESFGRRVREHAAAVGAPSGIAAAECFKLLTGI